MGPGMKVAAAVVGGYVLGRKKKAKLAITMGAWLVGKKLNLSPKRLLADVSAELGSSEQLRELRGQVQQEVVGAGKTMATTLLTQQAERLAGSLAERTQDLKEGAGNARSAAEEAPARTATTTKRAAGSAKKPQTRRKASTSKAKGR